MKRITDKQRIILDKHKGVVALYTSGKFTTENIAKNYDLSNRQVQRIARNYGVIRTQAESNKLIAPLKHYRTIPKEFRVKRKQISNRLRIEMILSHPSCTTCGMTVADGVRLEVDHIDNDPCNNDLSNLQVLCALCNRGKADIHRFS